MTQNSLTQILEVDNVISLGIERHKAEYEPAKFTEKELITIICRYKKVIRDNSNVIDNFKHSLKKSKIKLVVAKRVANIGAMAQIKKYIKFLDESISSLRHGRRELVSFLMSFMKMLDNMNPSMHTKAQVIGISHVLAKNLAKEHESENIILLMMSLPQDREDKDLCWLMNTEMVRRISEDPVAHRLTTIHLNKLFGSNVFPVPSVPKPRLVKTEGGLA